MNRKQGLAVQEMMPFSSVVEVSSTTTTLNTTTCYYSLPPSQHGCHFSSVHPEGLLLPLLTYNATSTTSSIIDGKLPVRQGSLVLSSSAVYALFFILFLLVVACVKRLAIPITSNVLAWLVELVEVYFIRRSRTPRDDDSGIMFGDTLHEALHRAINAEVTTACQQKTYQRIIEHFPNGDDLNAAVDEKGNTALHLTCLANDWSTQLTANATASRSCALTALIDAGADLSARNLEGETPLHSAVRSCDECLVETLLGAGADPIALHELCDDTPLHLAVRRGMVGAVTRLLDAGADVSSRNRFGETSLDVAQHRRHFYITKLLLTSPTVSTNTAAVNSALLQASEHGHSPAIPWLLAMDGADIATKDPEHFEDTPLHRAAENGHNDIVKRLLALGADPTAQNRLKESALHAAARNGYTDVVETLLVDHLLHNNKNNHFAELSRQNKFNESPLFLAVKKEHAEVARLLAKSGAMFSVLSQDDEWQLSTPIDAVTASLSLGVGADVVCGYLPL